MSQAVACFVHRGHRTFLSIAVAHAVNAGFRTIVIGDSQSRCRDAEFIDLREFESSARSFRDVYRHVGVNDAGYESFCYERWFILRDVMRHLSAPIWAFDHDVLTFDGLTTLGDGILWSRGPEPFMFNSAWTSLISDVRPLDILTDYYCRVFEDPKLHELLSQKHAFGGVPHLSDMYLLYELSELNKSVFLNAYQTSEKIGIDQNMTQNRNLGMDFELLCGYKIIGWDQKRPYVKRNNGSYQRFYSLHFQGTAKYLMPMMAQVPFEDEQATRDHCARMIQISS